MKCFVHCASKVKTPTLALQSFVYIPDPSSSSISYRSIFAYEYSNNTCLEEERTDETKI